MRKVFCLILALAVGMMAKADVVTTVNSVAEFQALAASVNAGDSYSGTTVTLTTDLNLSEVTWTPIGTTVHPFTGTFNGQGHSISNLSANGGSDLAAGLFGVVGSGGMVKDVHITSGTIIISENPNENFSHHGSIAGLNNGTIIGCSNNAIVTGYNYEHARVGGIAGTNNGNIQNCYNLGTVYTSSSNVFIGGIVGYNFGTVQNCFMRSTVITNVSDEAFYPLYGSNSGIVANCFYANGTTTDVISPYAPFALADNADNNTIISSNLGDGKNVLLSDRTLFTDGDWNTLCLPFDIPAGATGYSPIAGATVMTLKSSSFGSGTLTLDFENATSIEAGKPYIVKWDTPIAENLLNPVFMGVTLSNIPSIIETTNVSFVGSFSPVTLKADDRTKLYLGASNILYYPSKAKTIKSCRAYFEMKGITAGDKVNEARTFILNFGDKETDGLSHEIHVENGINGVHWYDLNGRCLNGKPTERGIYIHNGKKEVIK